jgi:predicted lysophospholipase L1 biosynthesis ABC-type transport system permease subunit
MTSAAPEPAAEPIGKSQLSLREAFTFFAFQSIRLRLGRMVVVLLGIIFAIAFLAVLVGTDRILTGIRRLSAQSNAAAGDTSNFQSWWMIVAVLIATVGICNAVLMSVTERIKEIGTLKCLGARALHILEIFLMETLLLGALGGLLGGILGVVATLALFWIQLKSDLWLVFGWSDGLQLVLYSVLLSLAISLVAAIIPVTFAAKIDPAEAMRYEV